MGCGSVSTIEIEKKEKNDNNDQTDNFSSNIHLMMEMSDDYHNFPKSLKKKGNNVIYYDQNNDKREEIKRNAEKFKKYVKGAFILVMDKDSLFLVLKEIFLLKTNCKFDLICTGSSCEEILDFIKKNKFLNIFKRCCLYTYNPDKYSEIVKKYSLVKGNFYYISQVLKFLKDESNSTPILRTLNLVTLNDYENNVKKIHFLVAKYYNNFSAYNYNKAIEKVKDFMDNPEEYKFRILNDEGERFYQKEAMLNILKLYEDIDNNYTKIIKNYTKEKCSVYQDFNCLLLNLNEKGIDAFGYFIAGLIYVLNKYNNEGHGVKSNRIFYRGMRLDMAEVLNYERYENTILCFPSFTSSSTEKKIAAMPKIFGGREVEIPIREREGLFSVLLTIKYNFRDGAVPNAVLIERISEFQTEKECIFLPFSFFLVKSVKINLKEFQCDMELVNISRKAILEEKLKNGDELNFLEDYIQIENK